MKKLLLTLFSLCLAATFSFAQSAKYEKINFGKIQKTRTINVSEQEDEFLANVVCLEAPHVSGDNYKSYLQALKKDITALYPPKENVPVQTRGDADNPLILNDFFGNNTGPGIPLDNHIAVSSSTDQLVSVINSHIAIMDEQGGSLKNLSLSGFSDPVDVNHDRVFDPRMIYDDEEDRFILVFLAGSESAQTDIVVGFSDTNDATGDWHVYSLPGNPNMNTTWTDYPMIAINKTDLIITGNLILDDVSWQLGFDETVIWQMDKIKGYNGEAMNSNLYKDVEFDGINIRNLCPVSNANETLEDNMYFLSNRNFAIESDTFFLVQLTGGVNEPSAEILVDVRKSNLSYGAPPDGRQEFKSLQTNDARVLEAIKLGDDVQFVGNTRNIENNLAGIYHGSIFNVSGTAELTIQHLHGGDRDLGYPGISYAGTDDNSFDVIINASHSGPAVYAGSSVIYYDPALGYSDWVTVREGESYIDMLNGQSQRWGDYSGSQRKYNDAGVVWISSSYGHTSNNNFTWIGKIARPDYVSSIYEIDGTPLETKVFPNPSTERIQIRFEVPQNTQKMSFNLLDANGSFITNIHKTSAKQSGESLISFNTNHLEKGIYFVQIILNDKIHLMEKIIVQ